MQNEWLVISQRLFDSIHLLLVSSNVKQSECAHVFVCSMRRYFVLFERTRILSFRMSTYLRLFIRNLKMIYGNIRGIFVICICFMHQVCSFPIYLHLYLLLLFDIVQSERELSSKNLFHIDSWIFHSLSSNNGCIFSQQFT